MRSVYIKRFWHGDVGATAIEYGLIAALVSVAAVAALTAIGVSVEALFEFILWQIDPPRCVDVGSNCKP